MRLPDLLRSKIEPILDHWEQFAQAIPHARAFKQAVLRDHARGILLEIAADLENAQTPFQQDQKAKGKAPPQAVQSEAKLHGYSRFTEGFDVNESIAEFRALRASVLRMFGAELALPTQMADDITRFNEAIDQAVAESLACFTEMKERCNRLFEALLANSPDLNYVVEPGGALVYANQAFADLVNRTTGELVGADFFALCAPYVGDIERHVRDAVTGERTYRGEMAATLDDGASRTYEYLLVPVFDLDREMHAQEWASATAVLGTALDEALAVDGPLTPAQRRSRDGLRARQVTIR